MKTMTRNAFIPFERLKRRYELVSMTAQELYDKRGIRMGEPLFDTIKTFSDGRKMEVSWTSASEPDEKAQIRVLLLDKDERILADVSEDYNDQHVMGLYSISYPAECIDPRDFLTGDVIHTPRGTFFVADANAKQMENAGYGYHHTSSNGKWLVYTNDKRGYAISAAAATSDEPAEMTYELVIEPEQCAVPLHCDIGTAYIDSKWLLEKYGSYFDDEFGGLFQFLDEYTSEDSNEIISEALLAGAVLFTCDPDEDEPFSFPCDDGWKYMAFADTISNILDESNQDASKAIDCLLSL